MPKTKSEDAKTDFRGQFPSLATCLNHLITAILEHLCLNNIYLPWINAILQKKNI